MQICEKRLLAINFNLNKKNHSKLLNPYRERDKLKR